MLYDLPGRVAIVTGAASGIGLELTNELGSRGILVHALDRAFPEHQPWSSGEGTGQIVCHQLDVTDDVAVARLFAAIVEDAGRIDYLACCAAVFPSRSFLQIPPTEFEQTIAVNLTGVYSCMRAASPQMRKQNFGRVVAYSSTLARRGAIEAASYATTKGSIPALVAAAARDFERFNIHVSCVTPGLTDTPQARGHMSAGEMLQRATSHPSGRLGTPMDMVGATLFLLSEEGVSLNGRDLCVTGGASL